MLFRSAGALSQREMVSIKSGGAAATRIGQYKKRRRYRSENWSVLKAGALPQQEMGSIKSGEAAATRIGQYKSMGAAAARNG